MGITDWPGCLAGAAPEARGVVPGRATVAGRTLGGSARPPLPTPEAALALVTLGAPVAPVGPVALGALVTFEGLEGVGATEPLALPAVADERLAVSKAESMARASG